MPGRQASPRARGRPARQNLAKPPVRARRPPRTIDLRSEAPPSRPGADMTTTAPPAAAATCTLEIGGMICASCVGRVEKALNRVDGVTGAEVNLATEVATVHFEPAQVGLEELTAAVTRAGYTAIPRREARPATEDAGTAADDATEERDGEANLTALKRKWQGAPPPPPRAVGVNFVPPF